MSNRVLRLAASLALTIAFAMPAEAFNDRPGSGSSSFSGSGASSRGTLDRTSTIHGRDGSRIGTSTRNGLDGDITHRNRQGFETGKSQRVPGGYILRDGNGFRTGTVRDPR